MINPTVRSRPKNVFSWAVDFIAGIISYAIVLPLNLLTACKALGMLRNTRSAHGVTMFRRTRTAIHTKATTKMEAKRLIALGLPSKMAKVFLPCSLSPSKSRMLLERLMAPINRPTLNETYKLFMDKFPV